jgi:LacI family transcriptional regulator
MAPVNNLTLLVPAGNLLAYSYYSRALSTVKSFTAQHNYGCTLLTEDEVLRPAQDFAWSGRLDTPTDGIIVCSPYTFDYESYLRLFRAQGYPCVLIRRKTQLPGVVVLHDDDHAGTGLALEHLCRLGHRTIGYVGRWRNLQVTDRKKIYRRFLQEQGLPDEDRLVYEHPAVPVADARLVWLQHFRAWLKQLMLAPGAPTAFFCFNDEEGIYLINELWRLSRRVPQDVAVVGYDDSDLAEHCRPPLTSVRLPIEEMCEAACRLIIDRRTETSPPDVVFPNTLTVRESCGAYLADEAP